MQLHILTPLTTHSPQSLDDSDLLVEGDWVADLRGYPAPVYSFEANHHLCERTQELFVAPDYWMVGRDWLLEFTERTRLQEHLSVDGVGFWWSLNRNLFTPALTDLGNTFSWIDLLVALATDLEPSRLTLYGQHDSLLAFCTQTFDGATIDVIHEQTKRLRQWNQPPIKRSLIMMRALMGLLYIIYATIRRPDICYFTTTATFHRATRNANAHLQELYRRGMTGRLRKNGWRVALVETYGWGASWGKVLERGFLFPTDILFLLSGSTVNRITPWRGITSKWRRRWLEVEPALTPHMTYRGYDISTAIQPLLQQTFIVVAPQLEIMVHIWRIIFSLWRPKLLYLAHHSYGKSTISATIAARALGIMTVEYQHGIISRNHFAYLVPVKQLSDQARFPLCDQMIVWGDYVRRLFESAGVYPHGRVHVAGNPLMEALVANLPERAAVIAQLSIPAEKRHIVLYTSNGYAGGLATQLLESIAQTTARDDLYWIIKLHPAETTRPVWEETAQALGIESIKIIESEVDFYSLLAICDFHVSFASTTIIEAAVAGKLNLGISSPTAPDSMGYAEANAFLPISSDQLGPKICELLDSPEFVTDLQQQQRAFAVDWCLSDGESERRILDIVTRLMQEAVDN